MNRIHLLPLLLLAMTVASAQTITVYKSVDADGTVRFGDKPPDEDDSTVEIIQLPTPPPLSEPGGQLLIADMIATTERLREDRLRRTEAQAPRYSSPFPADTKGPSQAVQPR